MRINKLLIILCFLMGGLVVKLWNSSYINVVSSVKQHNKRPDNNEMNMEILIDSEDQFPEISEYDKISKRSLFSDTRRPVVQKEYTASVGGSQEKIVSSQYLLSAVVITKGKHIALIQSDRIKELQKVALGEILDGWILIDIQPRQITLERDGEIRKLTLGIMPSPKLAVQNENPEYKAKDVSKTIVEIDEHGDDIEYEEEYEDDPD